MRSVWPKISGRRRRRQPIIFAQIVRPLKALQLCRWHFSHKKNSVADFLQAKCNFRRKSAVLRFWAPLEDLGATYDNHLRLIGKCVVDFLLVLIELFSLGVTAYGWGATSEYRLKIGDFAPTGAGWPKISGRSDRPTPTNAHFFFSENYGKLSFVRYTNLHRFLLSLSQSTRLTDRQTDRILIARPRLHSTQRGKN